MTASEEAIIEPYSEKSDFTCITFSPDLKRFNLKEFNEDLILLMKKRVYDLCGCIGEKVDIFLNNKKINIKGFD